MFYAVLALLATKGLSVSKHSGAVSLFDKEFIKINVFDVEFSRWLHEAFELRQRADYREMFNISAERSAEVLSRARQFVGAVRKHLAEGSIK